MLGVADAALLERTIDAVAAGDARQALTALEECVEQGRDAGSFASDLEVRARELLVVQILGEVPAELSLTPEADAALQAQAERVEHARRRAPARAARRGARGRARRRRRPHAARAGAREGGEAGRRQLDARPARADRAPGAAGAAPAAPPRSPVPRSAAQRPPRSRRASGGEHRSASRGPSAGGRSATAVEQDAGRGRGGAGPCERPRRGRRGGRAASARRPQPARRSARRPWSPETSSRCCSLWPAVVDLVRGENALLGALIAEARPVELDGDDLTVAFASSKPFLRKKAAEPVNRAAVTEALRAVTGARWRLSYELRDELGEAQEEEPEPGRSARRSGQALHGGVRRRGAPRRVERESDDVALRGRRAAGRDERGERPLMPKQPRMPNMQQMMQQVQKMQQDMEARPGGAQERGRRGLRRRRHGDGEGERRPRACKEVTIDPAAVDPEDVEILADMVLAAINEALRMAQELAAAQDGRRHRRARPGRPRRPGPAGAVSDVLRAAGPAAGHRAVEAARASATAPPSGWPSTSCAPPTRTRPRWPTRSARSRRGSGCARSASTSPTRRAAASARTRGATTR